MISSLSSESSYPLLIPLLTCPSAPCLPSAHDADGNTALHHAAAAGHTKALRTLLQFGASPAAQNAYSWTPVAYSASKQLELYFRELVAEFERKRAEGAVQAREAREVNEMKRRGVAGGVRLVTDFEGYKAQQEEGLDMGEEGDEVGRMRAGSGGTLPSGYGDGYGEEGLKTPTSAVSGKRDGGSWSPVERWRTAGTPVRERERDEGGWTPGGVVHGSGGGRSRAWSGE